MSSPPSGSSAGRLPTLNVKGAGVDGGKGLPSNRGPKSMDDDPLASFAAETYGKGAAAAGNRGRDPLSEFAAETRRGGIVTSRGSVNRGCIIAKGGADPLALFAAEAGASAMPANTASKMSGGANGTRGGVDPLASFAAEAGASAMPANTASNII